MRLNNDKIEDIIARSLTGITTPEEQEELKAWLEEEVSHTAFYERITNTELVREKLKQYREIDVNLRLEQNRRMIFRRKIGYVCRRVAACAAIVLLFLGTWMFINRPDANETTGFALDVSILAGKKQAELILANGQKIMLGETTNTAIREQGAEIRVTADQINYEQKDTAAGVAYNTIRTPRGGEYRLTLADGSVVWLNASSELIYPVSFTNGARIVKLKGEAYFQVKRDERRKFIVSTGNYEVLVLGTTFNVSAYPDEDVMKTTLCSGKVLVTDTKSHKNAELAPGEQLTCNPANGTMSLAGVNTDLYTAWTRGRFQFDNTPIEEIFNILARWYDIDVFYANQSVRENIFTGDLPRFNDLPTLLRLIEQVSEVRFQIKGKTVMIR